MARKVKTPPLFAKHEDEFGLLAANVFDAFVEAGGNTDSDEVFATVTFTEWATDSPTHAVVENVDLDDDDESSITEVIRSASTDLDEDADFTVTVTLEDRAEASPEPVATSIDVFGEDQVEAGESEVVEEGTDATAEA